MTEPSKELDLLEFPVIMPGEVIPQTSTPFACYSPDGQFVTEDPVDGAMYWAAQRQDDANHYVTDMTLKQHMLWISTVYLNANHNWMGGPPLMWETLLQGDGKWSDWGMRYCTKAAALNGHLSIVRQLQKVGFTLASSNVEIPALED